MSMIKNIKPRKATGYDNIPGKLIEITHHELSIPLCDLINKSMKLRCFPGIMKSAVVAPLYKKDNNLKRDKYNNWCKASKLIAPALTTIWSQISKMGSWKKQQQYIIAYCLL